jgi:hypothetical protein
MSGAAKSNVAEVLAARKPEEAPVSLKYEFANDTLDVDLARIGAAQAAYDDERRVKRMKARAA